MTDLERLLRDTLTDPARALPPPADPLPGIRRRVRQQRRRRAAVALAAAAALAAIVVPGRMLSRVAAPAPQPAVGTTPAGGMLPWPARGPLAGDAALRAAAVRAWTGAASDRPRRDVSLLYAGRVGEASVVLLQGRDEAGRPLLAEVAGPAAGPLRLVRAEPLPERAATSVGVLEPDGTGISRVLVTPAAGRGRIVVLAPGRAAENLPVDGDGLAAARHDLGTLQLVVQRPVPADPATARRTGSATAWRVVGDGSPTAGALRLDHGPVRLVAPPAGWPDYPPDEQAYAVGAGIADVSGPLDLAVLFAADVDSAGHRYAARAYWVRDGHVQYVKTLMLVDGAAQCDSTWAGGAPADLQVLPARCVAADGFQWVWAAARSAVAGVVIKVQPGRPGERAAETGGLQQLGNGLFGRNLPTGPGTVEAYGPTGALLQRETLQAEAGPG
jgi:hypothetical protein